MYSQMKLYNRNFTVGERIEYMGWVNEGVMNSHISWQSYKPRFLILKGTEVLLFDNPPLNVAGLTKSLVAYKVYQTMFRVVKESETVDSRQHCFLLQMSGHEPRYLSVETRQELGVSVCLQGFLVEILVNFDFNWNLDNF